MVERLAGDKLEVLVGAIAASRNVYSSCVERQSAASRSLSPGATWSSAVVILIGSTSVPYMSKASTSTVACTGS
jgi:hypothetical protein